MKSVDLQAQKKDVGVDIDELETQSSGLKPRIAIGKRRKSSKHTIFRPGNGSSRRSPGSISPRTAGPEKKLTLFALRLAVLEKAATGLGALGFVWATVVLIGGFASVLHESDFWFITTILVIESARIFSRSHELEWQNQATWTITDARINSFRSLIANSSAFIRRLRGMSPSLLKIRKQSQRETGSSTNCRVDPPENEITQNQKSLDEPLILKPGWIFISRNISKALYWLQLMSATSCIVLSLRKLIKRDYSIQEGDSEKNNMLPSLVIFYSLALAEGLLFLVEKAYWEWEVSYRDLLQQVNKECKLGLADLISVRRFFYDAYTRCVHGSIFDGLKMDMVSFAMKLLDSISSDEQLIAARILCQFATNELYAKDTLKKIGIEIEVIERLVEILNWRSLQQEKIRESAAEILLKLADKKQNSLRVAEIPGAIESISSLLQRTRSFSYVADEIGESQIAYGDGSKYDFLKFNNLGLLILKRLARDPDNCAKIGNTRGLLPKIIDFTHAEERLLKDENPAPSQIQIVKKALQLLKELTSTTGAAGDYLRHEISEIVFTISNMRDMLRHGEKHPKMQKLSIQVLTFLALEDDATEKIGATGGILKELFNCFFKEEVPGEQNHVQTTAGEALAMLALESSSNCHRILKLQVLEKLVEALEVPSLRVTAARILRNLCAYTASEFYYQLEIVKASASTVLTGTMSEESKLQEVMIGLAAYVFKFMSSEESSKMFRRARIREDELAAQLVQILRKYQNPAIKVPRIRRFTIELVIWMMEHNAANVKIFKDLEVDKELENVSDTTAELENYDVFSGTIGVTRHPATMHPLVEAAAKILES